MEEALLLPKSGWRGGRWRVPLTWNLFLDELKKVASLASPMVVVFVSQYLLQVVSLMMAGHLGELSLAGVAIATSITNVTGFSLLAGLSGALETLCGQAYGAGQHQKLGTYTYCAMLSLVPICIPIIIMWMFMDKLLISLGQEPDVASVAYNYSAWLMPGLIACAILQAELRYFLSQSMILPVLLIFCATLCFHVPACWVLVYKTHLGYMGAAFAISISYSLGAIFLGLCMRFSSSCEKTRSMRWEDALSCTKEFLCYGFPSAVMVCLEWWTFEIVILLSGLLPDSQLQTSVLSICLTVDSLHYCVQYAVAVAASTRISNELGGGNPQTAQGVVVVVVAVSIVEASIVSTILFCCRRVLGYAFSDNVDVVDYLSELAPFLCLSIISDGLHAILSGVARGCGWQRIGAIINLGAYYFAGLPLAVVLAFVVKLRGKGLWIGVLTGSALQAAMLLVLTTLTNWQKQATKARERIFEGSIPERTTVRSRINEEF